MQPPPPPRWLDRLLTWLVAPHLHEEVLGDLHERYHRRTQRLGYAAARRRYLREVLAYCRPSLIRRKPQVYPSPFFLNPDMLRNYFTVAWRTLTKSPTYSLVNLIGLALGMACSLLIGLWIYDELSYDRFLPHHEQIHFVRVNYNFRGGETQTAFATPGPLADVIDRDIPSVAATTILSWPSETLVRVGDKVAKETGQYASVGFFDVFELPAVQGNAKTALANLNQIVISQKMAATYFPEGQAVGKTLQLDNKRVFVVGAVLENLPANSTLQFDWLVNFTVEEKEWQSAWTYNAVMTYLRLRPDASPAQAETAMKGLFRRYATFDNKERVILQPITQLHLWGDYKNGVAVGGQIEYVRLFGSMALFILLIACINFMNLSTARSAMRTKEVGVRKVVGAGRLALMGQFLSESLLMSLLGAVVALGLVWLLLPPFNAIFDKRLALDLADPARWVGLLGLILLTGLLSGSYPALFLSGLRPVRILKSAGWRAGTGPAQFRRALVVFQFALSVFLIVGMLTVGQQMHYLRTKHLGLDRDNVAYVTLEGALNDYEKTEQLRQQLLQTTSVAMATTTAQLPLNIRNTSTDLHWPGQPQKQLVSVATMSVGNDFIKTMGIKLVAGRDFRTNSIADTSCYLVNEAAAKLMGIKEPVGREITFWFGKGPIIGLMKDFHLGSMHQAIQPLVVTFMPPNTQYLLIRPRAGQTPQALADLERLVKQANPNYPFAYHFLDEAYEDLYQREQQVSTLINYAGALAILISCLGLFGLATFTAEQRTKEIGVRKVLGASVASIVALLGGDFLRLVLVAILIASPLAWWAMHYWLADFAYKITIEWWVFALAGVLAVGIALLTVSFQSIRAAVANPVKSLRTE
ncbi:ABC transporter permease [Fibrella aquatilis]|nr:ABC transporter permease [Fibrella aquatilis]